MNDIKEKEPVKNIASKRMFLFKIISNILTMIMIIFAVIIIYAALPFGDKSLLGYRLFIVASGSMADTIMQGELILTVDVPEDELNIGEDIITFVSSDPRIYGKINTHRLISEKDGLYITKGDANEQPDEAAVRYEDILGRVAFHSRSMGAVIGTLSKPQNLFLFIILPIMILSFADVGKAAKIIRRLLRKEVENEPTSEKTEIIEAFGHGKDENSAEGADQPDGCTSCDYSGADGAANGSGSEVVCDNDGEYEA